MSDKIHLEYPNPIRVRGVVLYENGIILIKRNRIENGKEIEYYVFPGGGLENDEDLHSALTRELHEELGIEVTINEIIHEDVFNGIRIYISCANTKVVKLVREIVLNFIPKNIKIAEAIYRLLLALAIYLV